MGPTKDVIPPRLPLFTSRLAISRANHRCPRRNFGFLPHNELPQRRSRPRTCPSTAANAIAPGCGLGAIGGRYRPVKSLVLGAATEALQLGLLRGDGDRWPGNPEGRM
jgi:hypothetical protein